MPDDVRTESRGQTGARAVTLQDLPEADARQRSAAAVDEEPRGRLAFRASDEFPARALLISGDPIGRLCADGNDALLVALADARQVVLVEMEVSAADADEL